MTDGELLVMLKANLEIITDYMDAESKTAKEAELMNYINTAKAFIEREGVSLSDSIEDAMLTVMYAGWLYDRRKDPSVSMPRMIRWALNNRLFSQKIQEYSDES